MRCTVDLCKIFRHDFRLDYNALRRDSRDCAVILTKPFAKFDFPSSRKINTLNSGLTVPDSFIIMTGKK